MSQNILLKLYETTSDTFTLAPISADQFCDIFMECMEVLDQLNEIKKTMVPHAGYPQQQSEQILNYDLYERMQITCLEKFSLTELSERFIRFEAWLISTKPAAKANLHIFMDQYAKLKENVQDVVDVFYMDNVQADLIRAYVDSCIYNLVCFVVIQYNLECVCFGWTPDKTCSGKISTAVLDACAMQEKDLGEYVEILKNAYHATRTKFPALQIFSGYEERFLDTVRYIAMDLEQVPELVQEQFVRNVLDGSLDLLDIESIVYDALQSDDNTGAAAQ